VTPQTLGARLRQLRHEKSLTLADVSTASGVSVSYINDIEHDRNVPTLARLRAITEIYGLSVREALNGVALYD